MRNRAAVIFLVMLSIALAGCGANHAGNPANVGRTTSSMPINYGNGVYYFPYTGADYGNALSSFLEMNDCRVEGVTGNGTGAHGVDLGYFVVCR